MKATDIQENTISYHRSILKGQAELYLFTRTELSHTGGHEPMAVVSACFITVYRN